MTSRGALYICWGDGFEEELERSIASVERQGLPVHVQKLEGPQGLWAKAVMYDYSPFDETIFLDTETVVFDDIGFGFNMAREHGVSVSLAPACYANRFAPEIIKDAIEYNTGVVFFRRSDRVAALFEKWKRYAEQYRINDQTSFARAILEKKFNPFVLPPNWNYRARLPSGLIFGPIKIWHSRLPIPDNIQSWNEKRPFEFGELVEGRGGVSILSPVTGRRGKLRRLLKRALDRHW